jgi:hypothetical protein
MDNRAESKKALVLKAFAVQEVGLRRCRNILVARYTGGAKGYIDYDYPEFSRT